MKNCTRKKHMPLATTIAKLTAPLNLNLRPHEEFSMTSQLKKKKIEAWFTGVCTVCWYYPKVDS